MRSPASSRTKRNPSTIDAQIFSSRATGGGRRQLEREQHRDDGEEAQGIDRLRRRVAVLGADDDAGERGPDNPPEVVLRRRQRDRALEILDGNEVGQQRGERGEPERGARAVAERDQRDRERRRMPGREHEREQGGEHGLRNSGRHQEPLAREPVGERAAERAEDRDREERGRGHRSRPRRLMGAVGHVEPERDRLHPRADVRHERAGPHARVRRMTERRERARLPARGCGLGFDYGLGHCGARFSRNARMPSCASSACALSIITGHATSYASASRSARPARRTPACRARGRTRSWRRAGRRALAPRFRGRRARRLG